MAGYRYTPEAPIGWGDIDSFAMAPLHLDTSKAIGDLLQAIGH
jgi:hypothetical protein